MQSQINEIAPTLELFVDETIQPSVANCEELQKQLCLLQENLAIYKYNKINKEISPSFSIHAKVSEMEKLQPFIETPKEEVKIQETEKIEVTPPIAVVVEEVKISESKTIPPFTVGINDKFRFINELFKQSSVEYNVAIEQLSGLKNWNDTEIYLNSLKTLYDWKDNNDTVVYFFSVTKKRFN
jgi:hypothetical protein